MKEQWQTRFDRAAEQRASAEERYHASRRRRALLWLPLVVASVPVLLVVAVAQVVCERYAPASEWMR